MRTLYFRVFSLHVVIFRARDWNAGRGPRWGVHSERGDAEFWGGRLASFTNIYLGPISINADWIPDFEWTEEDPMAQPWLDAG